MEEAQTIPARRGKAAFVQRGQTVKVINTHGEQVVDTWAFVRHDLREFMSMEHTRATLVKIMPAVGDCLYTTRRRPILKIVEDTSPGIHDTLMAACDDYRYGLLGCTGYHDNCTDNLWAAMHALGLTPPETPSPLNLFMNIPWQSGGALSFDPPLTRPGDYIVLEAQLDLVVAFSACPQDILPINGKAGRPTEAHYRISDPRPESGTRPGKKSRPGKKTPAVPKAVARLDTTAGKIRALAGKGWSDSEIARALGIRYQQAYNTSHRPTRDYDPSRDGHGRRGSK